MKQRRVGKTNLEISEIGFGCGNTGGLLTGGTFEAQVQAVRRALDLGITYFDTAPNYGERVFTRGRSEENLGRVFRELGTKPTIGTKIELHERDMSDLGGAISRSVDESLARLGVDDVDILYLHNRVGLERNLDGGSIGGRVSLDDVLGSGGVLEAFERQRQEGKVRLLAFCSSGGDPIANHKVIANGGFHCVQLIYNMLEPTEGRLPPSGLRGEDHGQTIGLAGEHGLGVVVIRVLAGGVLSSARVPHALNTGSAVERTFKQESARADSLRFLERPGEQTLAQAAIRFALARPEVSTVLVGFSEMGQIDEAAAASEQGPISASDLQRIEGFYRA